MRRRPLPDASEARGPVLATAASAAATVLLAASLLLGLLVAGV